MGEQQAIRNITLDPSNQPETNVNDGWQKFTVDEGAIDHFIHAQNGTLPTAIRELVMNAIDAGSSSCHIILKPKYFSVQDFGKGFVDNEEIRFKFGHFAQNRDRSDSVYARFRIGRGQCMSLAKMHWRSNTFSIKTDVKQHGNAYRVESGLPQHDGCLTEGEMYNEISEWDLRRMREELQTMFKFAGIEITLNGLRLNSRLPDSYWDVDTDEFSIKYDPQREDGLRLYNLGVYVKEMHYHRYGFNADIVSKVPFILNMARNELHETDTVFPKIERLLKAKAIEIAKEKQRRQKMDEVSRRNLINRFLAGDISFNDVLDFGIIRECRGHYLKLNSLWNNKTPLTIAIDGLERVADRLAAGRIAQVLHPEEARLWGVDDAAGLIQAIIKLLPVDREHRFYHRALSNRRTEPFILLAQGIRTTHSIVKTSGLTPSERATLNALTYTSKVMATRLNAVRREGANAVEVRKIVPGESDTMSAWTDGNAMIAFNTSLLSLPQKGLWGAIHLCQVMLHEYCHDEPNSDSHDHDLPFFQMFHDANISETGKNEVMGHCLTSFIGRYLQECQKNDLAIPADMVQRSVGRYLLTYTLHFNGKRKLSAFSETLLLKAGFVIQKRGKAWELRYNGHRVDEGDSRKGVSRWLNTLLAEQNLPLLATYDDPLMPPEFLRDIPGVRFEKQPRWDWIKKTSQERLTALCEALDVSTVYHEVLHPKAKLPRYCFGAPMLFAESVLSLVCNDPLNDAVYFTTQQPLTGYRLGNANALFSLTNSEAYEHGVTGRDEPQIGDDPIAMQRLVLQKMKTAINSLLTPELRQEFIDTFITEKLSTAMELED